MTLNLYVVTLYNTVRYDISQTSTKMTPKAGRIHRALYNQAFFRRGVRQKTREFHIQKNSLKILLSHVVHQVPHDPVASPSPPPPYLFTSSLLNLLHMPPVRLELSTPFFKLSSSFLLLSIALRSTMGPQLSSSLEGEGRRKFGSIYILLLLSPPQMSHEINQCFSYDTSVM